jgi:uncharacterized membrane protein YeaQ/YmgE (transglycosylase-associated protein family)
VNLRRDPASPSRSFGAVALAVIVSLLFGAFLGWIYSVLARTDTNERIVIDILVGALGAVAMALALGNNSVFDSVVAAFLGSFVALALLYVARGRLSSRRH